MNVVISNCIEKRMFDIVLTNLASKDITVSSRGTGKTRNFLVYVFVPVFLAVGIILIYTYYNYPYIDSTGTVDTIAEGIKNTFGDWFKLWLGAFIGFVSAIVTYYFSKEEG